MIPKRLIIPYVFENKMDDDARKPKKGDSKNAYNYCRFFKDVDDNKARREVAH